MPEKIVVRSTEIDKHGDQTPLERLEEYIASVNSGQKMRYLVNHRRDIPPLGYLSNAEINKEANFFVAVVEPIVFTNRTQAEWDQNLFIEDAGQDISFKNRNEKSSTEIKIAIDKNNIVDFDSFDETIGEKLGNLYNQPISLEIGLRKGFTPDPQLVISLANYYFVIYPLVKPFLTKFGEKIAEDFADDTYNLVKSKAKLLISKIAESVKLLRKQITPQEKTLLTIFEIPGIPYVELHIKSDDPNTIVKGLSEKKLLRVHKQIKELSHNIDMTEIYFVFNSKQKWEFSYLVTEKGKIVGTKASFKIRDKLIKRINLSPNKGLSIGADGVKFEKKKKGS